MLRRNCPTARDMEPLAPRLTGGAEACRRPMGGHHLLAYVGVCALVFWCLSWCGVVVLVNWCHCFVLPLALLLLAVSPPFPPACYCNLAGFVHVCHAPAAGLDGLLRPARTSRPPTPRLAGAATQPPLPSRPCSQFWGSAAGSAARGATACRLQSLLLLCVVCVDDG